MRQCAPNVNQESDIKMEMLTRQVRLFNSWNPFLESYDWAFPLSSFPLEIHIWKVTIELFLNQVICHLFRLFNSWIPYLECYNWAFPPPDDLSHCCRPWSLGVSWKFSCRHSHYITINVFLHFIWQKVQHSCETKMLVSQGVHNVLNDIVWAIALKLINPNNGFE